MRAAGILYTFPNSDVGICTLTALLSNLKLVNCENIVSYGICFFLGLGFVVKGFSFNPMPVTHQLYEHRDIFFSPLKLMFSYLINSGNGKFSGIF